MGDVDYLRTSFIFSAFSVFSMQDLRAAFQKIDYDRNGLITRPEFRRILDSFMFLLSDEEFDKLMLNLGIQKGAKLNYREFLKRFEHVETVEEGHPWLYSTHRYAGCAKSKLKGLLVNLLLKISK